MLRLKIFINQEQIDDVVIQNISNLGNGTFYYMAYKINKDYKIKGKTVFVAHKRKEGWEVLAVKALEKLLREKK